MNHDEVLQLLISPNVPIVAALRQMDEAGEKILFVAEDERLLGAVTDGDIRRLVLCGGSLESAISAAMNVAPHFVREGYNLDEVRTTMVSRELQCLPVLDAEDRVRSAIRWVDLFEPESLTRRQVDLPVVIMAGGRGNRLAPLTNLLPKALVPVGDKPIIEHVMARFAESGCREFHLSLNFKAALIKAYFSDIDHPYTISYIEEEQPLGTAGSLALLRGATDSPFFVSNCDILIDADYADFYEFHRDGGYSISLVASMKEFLVPYGVCEIATGGVLQRMIEKPAYNLLVSTGLYLLEPKVLEDIPLGRRFDITDLLNDYIARKQRVGVYPVSERSWMDMGQWEELQKALERMGVR